MVMVKKLSFFMLQLSYLLISFQVASLHAETTAKLSRQSISVNESVNLVISSDNNSDIDSAFLAQVETNFDIDNQGKSSETSCVNFKCSSKYKTTFLLTPKKVGLFTIPALTMKNDRTQPLQIKVNPVNEDPDQNNLDPFFAKLTANTKQVSVQEQIIVTLRVNSSMQLSNLQLEPFTIPHATLQELTNTNYQRTIADTPYTTYEISYAVFPQKSGSLEIPAIRIFGVVPDNRHQGGFGNFFNTGRKVSIRSNALTLDVSPSPQGSHDEWLPAQAVIIKEKWLSDLNEIKVGDSITREITLSALGLTAEQLPAQVFAGNAQFKIYQEKPELENKANEKGVIGIRKEKMAIVPNTSGDIVMPAVHVTWWDVETQQFKKASLPETTLHIKPNPELSQLPPPNQPMVSGNIQPLPSSPPEVPSPAGSAPQTSADQSILWKIIALCSLVINLIFGGLQINAVLQRKTNTTIKDSPQRPQDTLKALEEACHSKDPDNIRSSLLAYSRTTWPTKSLHSLTDIARTLDDEEAHNMMAQIDTAIYNKTSVDIDIKRLKQAFTQASTTKDNGDSSKTLYPTH